MADFRALTQTLTAGGASLKQIIDADSLICGAGLKTAAGDLTVTPAGTNMIVASGKVLSLTGATISSGASPVMTGTILGGGSAVFGSAGSRFNGLFTTTLDGSGAATLGSTLDVTGLATFTAAVRANGGIQRSSAGGLSVGTDANTTSLTMDPSGTVSIGGTNATTITIGRTGQAVNFPGNVTVTGTEVVTGATTFEGNVQFGDATTDTVTFTSRLSGDLNALKEAAHQILIDASTTAGSAGGAWTYRSGAGAAGTPAAVPVASGASGAMTVGPAAGGAGVGTSTAAQLAAEGGAGGAITLSGGTGGAGSTTGTVDNAAAGAGGGLTLSGGNAGASGSGTGIPAVQGAGGTVTIDGGTAATGGTAGAVNIGATNASSVGIGRSGITSTVTGGLTQLTGAVSLTGNAASSFTTSAGALTLTAAAASTWSTSAGALTLTSAAAATWSTAAGALTLNGTAGLNLQSAATAVLNLTSTTAVIQTGITLSTTGTGMINLPALFQIAGLAVGALVTAPNLTTLTDGSNADSLHTHTGVASTSVTVAGTSGAAIDAGELVSFGDSAGSPRVFRADATSGGGERPNAIGVSQTTAGAAGVAVTVQVNGERAIPDAQWTAVPAVTDVGKRAYVSKTAGSWTIDISAFAAGDTILRTGYVTVGGAGAVKVLLDFGEPVVL